MSDSEALIDEGMLLDELLVGMNGWHETADGCACCAHEEHGCCGAKKEGMGAIDGCAAACEGDGGGDLHEAPKHLPPLSLAPDEDSYAGGSKDDLQPEWREFCKHTHEILSMEGRDVPKCSHLHVRVHRSAIEKRRIGKATVSTKSLQTHSASEMQEDNEDVPKERKRNREAVRNYRARKKAYVNALEEEVEHLRSENQRLRYDLRMKETLEAEHHHLRALVSNAMGILGSFGDGVHARSGGYYPGAPGMNAVPDVFRLPMTTLHIPGCEFGKPGEPQSFPSCPGAHCPTNLGQPSHPCPSGTDTQRGSLSHL